MSVRNNQIQFHYLYPPFYFKNRNQLKIFLANRLKKEGKKIDCINYIFCDDNYLRELNQQYLRHDTFTDIVTFEISSKQEPLLSDIYISIDRVKENSIKFQTSFTNELHRVIFHGILHLIGFNDKTIAQVTEMRNKEQELLANYLFHVEHRGTKD